MARDTIAVTRGLRKTSRRAVRASTGEYKQEPSETSRAADSPMPAARGIAVANTPRATSSNTVNGAVAGPEVNTIGPSVQANRLGATRVYSNDTKTTTGKIGSAMRRA